MLTTKQITGLLYSMGHTFDNLASTYIATEEFLTTNDPQVIGSRGDLALLQDLQAASRCMLHYDYSHGLTLDFIRGLNASMTRTAAVKAWFKRLISRPSGRTLTREADSPERTVEETAACQEEAGEATRYAPGYRLTVAWPTWARTPLTTPAAGTYIIRFPDAAKRSRRPSTVTSAVMPLILVFRASPWLTFQEAAPSLLARIIASWRRPSRLQETRAASRPRIDTATRLIRRPGETVRPAFCESRDSRSAWRTSPEAMAAI